MTEEILKAVYPLSHPDDRAKFIEPLRLAVNRYDINTANRLRAFLAQLGHESGQLSRVTENLNYSVNGLMLTFGKYFKTKDEAICFARQPERIANHVYADRMGNGSEASGEGWKYRGRGLIQLTGKENYRRATEGMQSVNFVTTPDALATPEYAAQSAGWFWQSNGLNELADKLGGADDYEVFKQITKRINGGYNGLEDRTELYENTKKVIK